VQFSRLVRGEEVEGRSRGGLELDSIAVGFPEDAETVIFVEESEEDIAKYPPPPEAWAV